MLSPRSPATSFEEPEPVDAQIKDLTEKAAAIAHEGRPTAALALLEECLRVSPGYLPARRCRAAALVELGRFAEARPELVQRLTLQPEAKTHLEEMLAMCDAALVPHPAVPTVEQRGPGSIAVRLSCPADRLPAAANMWARRISAALETSFKGRIPVRWWEETVSPKCVWIDAGPEGGLVGRVCLRRDPEQADRLLIDSTTAGMTPVRPLVSRFFNGLYVLAGIAGLIFWVWLIVKDWNRIWNRLSFSDSGDRASKLEIYLLAIGWLICPVIFIVPVGILGSWITAPFEKRSAERLPEFARREIDPVVSSAVAEACANAQTDPTTRVDLGLGSQHFKARA